MFKIVSFDEWQFVDNQSLMQFPLDSVNGSGIELRLYSEKPVTVAFYNSVTDDKLLFAKGTDLSISEKTIGFDTLQILGPNANSYAVQLYVSDQLEGEFNSGEMAVLEIGADYNAALDREVQHALIQQLASTGFGQDEIQDILDGVNAQDFDLDFEDEDSLPTPAEMDEMITLARANASESLSEDADDANSDTSGTPPPEEGETAPESEK